MTAQYATPAFGGSGDDEGMPSTVTLSIGSKSNALFNKITSVLSASYVDSEIRNALGLLDARGTTNTAETRRDLKLDAQKQVIDCNAAILDEFGQVAEQLKRVGAMITTLNNTCEQMRKHIALAKAESTPMLEEASVLIAGKQECEAKQAVLDAFTKHFVIADDDLDVLTSSAIPVNDQFFLVLNRVKKIHDDCEPLLGSENERLGLDLMEQTSRSLDAGFKKLYSWVQRALKGLDFEDPQISGSIRHALRVLSERPALFQNCLEFLAEAREQTLSIAFQSALSGEGEASGSAIEFSAHDLLRYMGDMLAWVHSTTVSERESLEGLFIKDAETITQSMKLGRVSEPWLQDHGAESTSNDESGLSNDQSFDGEQALKELVSRSLATISISLRERIELAVHQHDEVVPLFKAQNLLTFYHDLFAKLLSSTSTLSTTISRLEKTAQDHIYQILATIDSDSSWLSDPVEGPIRHKENLSTLSALFAIKSPAEMSSEQLKHFLEHYAGGSRVHCEKALRDHQRVMDRTTGNYLQIAMRANTSPDPESGGYSVVDLTLAIVYTATTIKTLRPYTNGEETDIDERLAEWPGALMMASKLRLEVELLRALEEAMVDRIADEMLRVSGVAELQEEELDAAVLAKLPGYAARLDDFLSTGYNKIVAKVKGLDEMAKATEEEDGVGCGGIEQLARARFMDYLRPLLVKLEEMGGEYRERYPRTEAEVKVLIE